MRRIIIDFETRSEINIQKCGTWRYAMDNPRTFSAWPLDYRRTRRQH